MVALVICSILIFALFYQPMDAAISIWHRTYFQASFYYSFLTILLVKPLTLNLLEHNTENLILSLKLIDIFLHALKNNKVVLQTQARIIKRPNNNNPANNYGLIWKITDKITSLTFMEPYIKDFHRKSTIFIIYNLLA